MIEVDDDLVRDWSVKLRADGKSINTQDAYLTSAARFRSWAAEQGIAPMLDRSTVTAYVAYVLESQSGSTAGVRLNALKQLARFAVYVDATDTDDLRSIQQPPRGKPAIEPLSDAELTALLNTCKGKTFTDKRDTAIIRVMIDNGIRAGELVAMELEHVDLTRAVMLVKRGKGNKGRWLPLGDKACLAISVYLRARKSHSKAAWNALWLGDRGLTFAYAGLYKMLTDRATAAGIDNFHPHRMRHTFAHRWLANGGNEQDLMALGGWERPDMIQRYARARASDRAIEASRVMRLGDSL